MCLLYIHHVQISFRAKSVVYKKLILYHSSKKTWLFISIAIPIEIYIIKTMQL